MTIDELLKHPEEFFEGDELQVVKDYINLAYAIGSKDTIHEIESKISEEVI